MCQHMDLTMCRHIVTKIQNPNFNKKSQNGGVYQLIDPFLTCVEGHARYWQWGGINCD